MSEDKKLTSVHVEITLKPEMQGEDNKWSCTINGEKKSVLMQNIEFQSETIESAVVGINESEIDEITISTGWKKLEGLKK